MRKSEKGLSKKNGKSVNHSNFTLLELLIVIAVIAILASLLLPALHSVMGKARSIQCTGNLKSIGQLLIMYVYENDDWPPICVENYQKGCSQRDLPLLLVGKSPTAGFVAGVDQRSIRGAYLCPSASLLDGANFYRTSYRMAQGLDNSSGNQKGGVWYKEGASFAFRKYSLIANGSVILTEGPFSLWEGTKYASSSSAAIWYSDNYDDYMNNLEKPNRIAYENHRNQANFLFKDGHVKTYRLGSGFSGHDPCWVPK